MLLEAEPDVVLVPGDVNSTMAAALIAREARIPLGHVEAGLRSFDRTMPEEINRVVADQLSQLLFIHSPEARDNLLRRGLPGDGDPRRRQHDDRLARRDAGAHRRAGAPATHGLERGATSSSRCTGPRSSTARCSPRRWRAGGGLGRAAGRLPGPPANARSARCARRSISTATGCGCSSRVGYIEFLSLVGGSAAVLTDSGGIQEETTYLGLPCFTLRANTERPITVSMGTNTLLGLDPERIADVPALLSAARQKETSVPPLWDGKAAERIVDVLARSLGGEPVEQVGETLARRGRSYGASFSGGTAGAALRP